MRAVSILTPGSLGPASRRRRGRLAILTGYDDAEQVFHALRVGASAYCSKDIPPEGLLSTIYSVYNGSYVVHGQTMTYEEVIEWIENRLGRNHSTVESQTVDLYSPLSPREMEILEMVTKGSSNKEIAFRLRISQQTVKNHMTAILRKLHVDDRTQAAVYALRHGWVRIDTTATN